MRPKHYDPKLVSVLAGLGVAIVDFAVVVIPITDASLQQISLPKIAFALATQAILLMVLWATLEVLVGQAYPSLTPWLAPFKSKTPFIVSVVFCAALVVSASLLYNGAVCGDHPFVLHKNTPLCPQPSDHDTN